MLQELKVEQQLEELRVGVITTLSECEKEHGLTFNYKTGYWIRYELWIELISLFYNYSWWT